MSILCHFVEGVGKTIVWKNVCVTGTEGLQLSLAVQHLAEPGPAAQNFSSEDGAIDMAAC